MSDISTSVSNPVRPRLWVETLWLLDSLTATQPLREIPLQRGLNLIVSPPGRGSSGHGVGKTAFCQLLRFALDDPLWSDGSTLRDELLHSHELKEGAVAARVHVGGETWTVLKPWLHQKQYRASRTADWRQLAANDAENEFAAYQAALRRHLVEILPSFHWGLLSDDDKHRNRPVLLSAPPPADLWPGSMRRPVIGCGDHR